jgi:uncharacterized protein (DUF2267 family)
MLSKKGLVGRPSLASVAERAAGAVLGVLTERVSAGEIDQLRHVLPERVRDLWPVAAASR